MEARVASVEGKLVAAAPAQAVAMVDERTASSSKKSFTRPGFPLAGGPRDRNATPAKLQRKKERERLRRSVLKDKIETLRKLLQPYIPNGQTMERAFILSETAKLLRHLIQSNAELKLMNASIAASAASSGGQAAPPPDGNPNKAGPQWLINQIQKQHEELDQLKKKIAVLDADNEDKAEQILKLQGAANKRRAAIKSKRGAPTKKACTNCVAAKRRCDSQRPCGPCVKRGCPETCRDVPKVVRTKRFRAGAADGDSDTSGAGGSRKSAAGLASISSAAAAAIQSEGSVKRKRRRTAKVEQEDEGDSTEEEEMQAAPETDKLHELLAALEKSGQ